ncbi:hypothetical protein KZ810_16340 [Sphingomonas sp. RHCKR47]|uniref:hypothetical protein n=1 Tax=Sphingomonas citricola TaxID=2862498 RepID=UPI001CA533AB|nr:hypothetical protein [Sphingomonas citricola]MBW6525066.1 hypothetical protein [Sphingomonas citricola]
MTTDLGNRMRELLADLREARQPIPNLAEVENELVLAILKRALNRPSNMTRCQEAYADWLIEEAEEFAALAATVVLEVGEGFTKQQRSSLGKIIVTLRSSLEQFANDFLLAIGDRQEIRRRIEAG